MHIAGTEQTADRGQRQFSDQGQEQTDRNNWLNSYNQWLAEREV